jgi:hypothetical protein
MVVDPNHSIEASFGIQELSFSKTLELAASRIVV